MRLRNFTPHPIRVVVGDVEHVWESEGVARVSESRRPADAVCGIPVHEVAHDAPFGLPEPERGVVLIVSQLVLGACDDRDDLVAPDTGVGAVRDAQGRIVAVTGFVVPPHPCQRTIQR